MQTFQNSVTAAPATQADPAPQPTLEALAAEVRARQALGRSIALNRLFDFLVTQSAAGRAPKGVEIAEVVFGARVESDLSAETSVRVYIHRLRKKLDEHYAGAEHAHAARLVLNRGEYRLSVAPPDAVTPLSQVEDQEEPASQEARPEPPREEPQDQAPLLPRRLALLAGGAAALNLAAWGVYAGLRRPSRPPALRRAPWSLLAANSLPTIIVVGDYYVFGDTGDSMEVKRLIRDFTINSRVELDQYLMGHPDMMGRYTDVDLHYLPVSIASALQALLPLVSPPREGKAKPRIVLASELTPETVKQNNILYIGYLSGLGLLRTAVFAGSRFRVGGTYDELIDTVTQRHYVSEAGSDLPNDLTSVDYGYVSTFPGPAGGRVVVVAGARDVGLMQTAEAMASPRALDTMTAKVRDPSAFEALFSVEGMQRMNMNGRLLLAVPLNVQATWSTPPGSLQFPPG